MVRFQYLNPETLEDALTLLAQGQGRSQVLAGGSDLLVKLKKGQLSPSSVVNIKRLRELRGVSVLENGSLVLGALTRVSDLALNAGIREKMPALSTAAANLATPHIRGRATLGGNICNASPAADLVPPLLVYDAQVDLVALQSLRTLPLAGFLLGPGQTALKEGEILRSVTAPALPAGALSVYLKLGQRRSHDIAIVGVAALLVVAGGVIKRARLALGSVAATAVRAPEAEALLLDKAPTAEAFNAAADTAAQKVQPISDVRASADYRREMVRVLTRRALQQLAGDLGKAQEN